MRKHLLMAATAFTLSLSACAESGETYPVSVDEAWSKVSSSGYAASAYGLPLGLVGVNVQASFESSPGDRTAYWKFTRNGKDLGRVNVAVEGDQTSSKVSYSYVDGDVSGDNQKIGQTIRQIAQPLLVEAVDAAIENRSPEQRMKSVADAESTKQLIGHAMKETYSAIGKAQKESEKLWEQRDAEIAADQADAAAHHAQSNTAKPTTDLSSY